MTDEPNQETKDAVDRFIAEGELRLGGPGPHMTSEEIDTLIDHLSAQLDAVLPGETESERTEAKLDAYEYFISRLLGGQAEVVRP